MRSQRLLPVTLVALACVLFLAGCPKAPAPAQPAGPAKWLRGVAMSCTTRVVAPQGEQVSFQFDWGDNSQSEWSALADDGLPFADTHSFQENGDYNIRARVKTAKGTSGWSDPLAASVQVGEGGIYWSLGFPDPESPEDSADFSLNGCAMGPDSTVYVACDLGALIARKPTGSAWKLILPDAPVFYAAPTVAEDGTIYLGCDNDTLYAVNPNGTVKWRFFSYGPVNGAAALGTDGTIYYQNEDSLLIALSPDGSLRWTFYSHGGNSAPVIGTDGVVYCASQDGQVFGVEPSTGTLKWGPYNLGTNPVAAAPAIDPSRNAIYVVSDDGTLQALDLTLTGSWSVALGGEPSAPVIGPDGTVYVSGSGKLWALDPANSGSVKWTFTPPMAGTLSTPALSADGYAYVLAVTGKKDARPEMTDSLYGVNSDGTRRWACGLGLGFTDETFMSSAPKVDGSGLIYVGSGFRTWCVVGIGGPAQSAWPMAYRDARNSGRAR
jgi:outer membrane protein assembly factor BamB